MPFVHLFTIMLFVYTLTGIVLPYRCLLCNNDAIIINENVIGKTISFWFDVIWLVSFDYIQVSFEYASKVQNKRTDLRWRRHRLWFHSENFDIVQVGLRVSIEDDDMWHQRGDERNLEREFETIVDEYKKVNMQLDLILVIFKFKVCYDMKHFIAILLWYISLLFLWIH